MAKFIKNNKKANTDFASAEDPVLALAEEAANGNGIKKKKKKMPTGVKITIFVCIFLALICLVLAYLQFKPSAHDKLVKQYTQEYIEEGYPEKKAHALAERKALEEEDIQRRLAEGELIDGYNGYWDCKISKNDLGSGLIQIGDMVFNTNYVMDVDDVKKVFEDAEYEFTIKDVFVGGYPAIEVYDKKGKTMLFYLYWSTIGENSDFDWIKPGNYLSKIEIYNEEHFPYDKHSVYYPTGFHYYYSMFLEEEDNKTITRDELHNFLNTHNFIESTYYVNYGRDGYYEDYGTEETIVTYYDYSDKDKTKIDYAETMRYAVIRQFTYSWDTEGNLVEFKMTGSERDWQYPTPEKKLYE